MEDGEYQLDPQGRVRRRNGDRLDPWQWRWIAVDDPAETATPAIEAKQAIQAANAGGARRLPVAVIGPREATPEQERAAHELGQALGHLGLTVICGGRSGVMAAVAAGARSAGGLTIGILPDGDWRSANDDIIVPIATGLSEARNAVIAKAATVLIAVGGSYGTLTEAAYGRHFGKTVIGLLDPPEVTGLIRVDHVEDAIDTLCQCLLSLAEL